MSRRVFTNVAVCCASIGGGIIYASSSIVGAISPSRPLSAALSSTSINSYHFGSTCWISICSNGALMIWSALIVFSSSIPSLVGVELEPSYSSSPWTSVTSTLGVGSPNTASIISVAYCSYGASSGASSMARRATSPTGFIGERRGGCVSRRNL